MLALLFLLSADAAEPAPVDATPTSIVGWDVARYNDQLVALEWLLSQQLLEMADHGAPRDAAELETYRQAARAVVERFAADVRRMPAWEGDAAFRDALLVAAADALTLLDTEVRQIYALCARQDLGSAELAQADVLFAALDARAAAIDAATGEAQRAFATRHNLRLREEPPAPEPERFSMEGLVPADSHLPPAVVVGFASVWQNGLTADASESISAMNDFLVAMGEGPDAAERTRTDALTRVSAALAQSAARGDWRGDRALLDATTTLHTDAARLLSEVGPRLVAARRAPFRSQAEVNAYNKDIDTLNAEFRASVARFEAAQAAFLQRSGIQAFTAWAAAHPDPADVSR